MASESERSDKRYRLVGPELQPDRAEIWRRFRTYFLKKERLTEKDPTQRRKMSERLMVAMSSVNSWYGGRGLPDVMVFARFIKMYPLCNWRWLFWGEGPEEMVRGASLTDRDATETELRARFTTGIEQIEAVVQKVRADVTGETTARGEGEAARQRRALEAARRLYRELEQAVQSAETPGPAPQPKRGAR